MVKFIKISLFVHGRCGIEQQGHHMFDLRLGQDVFVTKARHVGARVVSACVVNLVPGVFNDWLGFRAAGVADAAKFSVVVQARAQGAVRQFFFRNLVAVVAVATIGHVGFVAPSFATPILCDHFALLPIAQIAPV